MKKEIHQVTESAWLKVEGVTEENLIVWEEVKSVRTKSDWVWSSASKRCSGKKLEGKRKPWESHVYVLTYNLIHFKGALAKQQRTEENIEKTKIFCPLQLSWNSILSFNREPTMTMHYCDVTNLSDSDSSREHSLSVHYKSLVIGLLLCRQVRLSSRAHRALGGAGAGIRLTLSEWLRYVYPGGTAASVFKRGHPAARAVDHQTSQSVRILPVSSQGQAAFDRHH